MSVETVFKYWLSDQEEQFVEMPASAQIVCVQMQNGVPCLWAQQPRPAFAPVADDAPFAPAPEDEGETTPEDSRKTDEAAGNPTDSIRRILFVGTGTDLPMSATRYIGTMQDGPRVWHVYEGGPA